MNYLLYLAAMILVGCEINSSGDIDQELIVSTGAEESHDLSPIICPLESPAKYPGGKNELLKFIAGNFTLPSNQNNIEEKLFIQLTIDTSGEIPHVSFIKGGNPALDLEIQRVMKLSPQWTPASINGKAIEQKLIIPLHICLNK